MTRSNGKTTAISTNWIIEVFDWDDEYPSGGGGSGSASGFSRDTSSIASFSGDEPAATQYGFLDIDILTTLTQLNTVDALASLATFGSSNASDLKSVFEGGSNVSSGVTSIDFARSKTGIDTKCSITVVGPLPSHTRSGNWIIVSSLESKSEGDSILLPRFIGQIQQIDTQYTVLSNGAIVLRNSIIASEWSHFLTTPIVWDLRSRAGFSDSQKLELSSFVNAIGADSKGIIEQFVDVTYTILNPYTAAKTYLSLIGLANSASFNGGPDSPENNELYKTASTFPAVPDKLLRRMGFPNTVTSTDAFATGFVQIIAGRQEEANPSMVDGWDGFFRSSGLDGDLGFSALSEAMDVDSSNSISLSSYVNSFNDFKGDGENQPYSAEFATIFQAGRGMSIWSAIQSECDPSLNEFYTDMYYDVNEDNQIRARPVLVVKGKSFRTKAAEAACFDNATEPTEVPEASPTGTAFVDTVSGSKDPLGSLTSIIAIPTLSLPVTKPAYGSPAYQTWNRYEDLPRIQVDSSLITGLQLSNSCVVSPNLFFVTVTGDALNQVSSQEVAAKSMFAQRHNAEALRFGSITRNVSSSYLFSGGNSAAKQWFETIANLNRVWDGYTYRMASGTLSLKDPGIPFSVGFNMQFSIPNKASKDGTASSTDFVVHIEAISTSFQILPDGQKVTSTNIGFSHMMQVVEGDSIELEFCPMSTWGDMWHNNKLSDVRGGGGIGW